MIWASDRLVKKEHYTTPYLNYLLRQACWCDNVELVEWVWNNEYFKMANEMLVNDTVCTACENGSLNAIKRLCVLSGLRLGYSHFTSALRSNNLELIRFVYENGFGISREYIPPHLVTCAIRYTVKGKSDMSIHHIHANNTKVVEYLLSIFDNYMIPFDDIWNAVKYGDVNILKILIKKLKQGQSMDNTNWVNGGLRVSCRCGYLAIVKYLLNELNADPTEWEHTAITKARIYEHADVVKELEAWYLSRGLAIPR
jgi:hypothetical protein